MNEDQQLLDSLLAGGSKDLERLYLQYRQDFVAFARKYSLPDEDILDIYQDTMIAFFENVRAGKLKKLSSTIKTYLFSIGKYKLIDRLKRNGKQVELDTVKMEQEVSLPAFEDHTALSDRQQELRAAINELGGHCKDLLILFYYRRYSIEAIQQTMDYKNENTVKATKSRCMKSLRAIIQQRGNLK